MPKKLQALKEWLELVSSILLILGVPVGLYQYYQTAEKERLDREYATYDALDDKFLEFQRLCMDHPELDVFDVPDGKPATLSPEQKKQELIAYTMLFSIFERAHLMYSDQGTAIKTRQWAGWDEYIRSFAKRANFREAWKLSGSGFDTAFEAYMAGVLAEPPKP